MSKTKRFLIFIECEDSNCSLGSSKNFEYQLKNADIF